MGWTRILGVLGWIGFVIMILAVVGVLGTIVIAMFLNWEFGVSLLLFGIIVIPSTVILAYCLYRLFPIMQQYYLGIPKFIKCPYCGMNNLTIDVFCSRCGKVLPKKRLQPTQSR